MSLHCYQYKFDLINRYSKQNKKIMAISILLFSIVSLFKNRKFIICWVTFLRFAIVFSIIIFTIIQVTFFIAIIIEVSFTFITSFIITYTFIAKTLDSFVLNYLHKAFTSFIVITLDSFNSSSSFAFGIELINVNTSFIESISGELMWCLMIYKWLLYVLNNVIIVFI